MGNRAVITTTEKETAIYLHWNGGLDSVEAFLKYCELKQYRADDYGLARLTQVIGNFFGGGLSLGIGSYKSYEYAADGDNGVYVIDNWQIVDRLHLCEDFEEQMVYDFNEMLKEIDRAQPEPLGDEYLDAIEINSSELIAGDVVFIRAYGDNITKGTVQGFHKPLYGDTVPYVDIYSNGPTNPNNLIRQKTVKVASLAPRPKNEPAKKSPKRHNRAKYATRGRRL